MASCKKRQSSGSPRLTLLPPPPWSQSYSRTAMHDSSKVNSQRPGLLESALKDFKNDWARNHALEIAVGIVAAVSAIARAGDLTVFAFLILAADCLALWAFYVISFNVVVQVSMDIIARVSLLIATHCRSTVFNPSTNHPFPQSTSVSRQAPPPLSHCNNVVVQSPRLLLSRTRSMLSA